jgi:alkylated DNA repair dioxygenase AlkB
LLLNIRGCRKRAGDWVIWRRSLKILESDAACLAIKEEEEEEEEKRRRRRKKKKKKKKRRRRKKKK